MSDIKDLPHKTAVQLISQPGGETHTEYKDPFFSYGYKTQTGAIVNSHESTSQILWIPTTFTNQNYIWIFTLNCLNTISSSSVEQFRNVQQTAKKDQINFTLYQPQDI